MTCRIQKILMDLLFCYLCQCGKNLDLTVKILPSWLTWKLQDALWCSLTLFLFSQKKTLKLPSRVKIQISKVIKIVETKCSWYSEFKILD